MVFEFGKNTQAKENTQEVRNQNQTEIANWLKDELADLQVQTSFDGEKVPALKFEENKVIKFTIDFSKKFDEYEDNQNKCIKAIIPVTHKNEKKVLWLNKKNPLYGQLIRAGASGKKDFAVSQTGNQNQTKYNLVEED